MSNVVRCPVHKKILKLERKKLEILGREYDVVAGACPKCRCFYIGVILEKCPRVVVDETLYCSIPELNEYQDEPREELLNQKIQLQNDRLEQARIDEIRKRELKKQEEELKKERERQELERKKREEEQKKAEERKRLQEEYPFLKDELIKVRIAPSKADRCPNHGNKLREYLCMITDGSGMGQMTVNGRYCAKCNALYLNPDLQKKVKVYAEKDLAKLKIKLCGDELWQELPEIRISKIQFPSKQKQEKSENVSCTKDYLFMQSGCLRIGTIQNDSRICPTHKKNLEPVMCVLKEFGKKIRLEFVGFYCPGCICVYQNGIGVRWLRLSNLGINVNNYSIALNKNRWEKPVKVKISEFSFLRGKKQEGENSISVKKTASETPKENSAMDETQFRLVAYQKFEKEIAEVAACVDGDEKYVRILTSVKEEDKRKCVPEDMLVREAEMLGRELLGRIAHERLDTFYAKDHKITIHQYKVWRGQDHHLDGFTKFSDPEKMQDITIMSQKNLDRDSEEYEMVTALVYCANRDVPVYIDVYYSKRQNKYFINDESYRQYSARYGLPYMHLVPGEYDGEMDYGNLRQYSELNLYGYTVAKTADMSSAARQRLLQQLMDNGLMSKHQIVNHLEWLLHRQSGRIRMEDACDCWKEDLRFVNDYKINRQRRICGRFVYGKNAL